MDPGVKPRAKFIPTLRVEEDRDICRQFLVRTLMEATEKEEQVLDVEIERLLPGGVGLAHAEGLTLFVSLAAPGDVLRVKIDRVAGKVAFASIVEILKPSSVRLEPPCPYFTVAAAAIFNS